MLRKSRYDWEMKEFSTIDILDKSLIRAKANKQEGLIDAPTYYRVVQRVMSLKKLKFTKEYEELQDKEMYEWMKHKVAAEVGGQE